MRTLLFLAAVLGPVAAGGCGKSDPRSTVKGAVTAGKDPLPGGTIYFVSVANTSRVGSGVIDPTGKYAVFDAPVGECFVLIENSHLDPARRGGGVSGPPGGMMGMGPGMGMGGMRGAPGAAAGGAPTGGPSAKDKDRMSGPPKGADVPTEMSAEKVDYAKMKYVKLDPKYARAESTPHKFTVTGGENSASFDVK